MKRKLIFIFGIISCWISAYSQVPELIYYKFDDSTNIQNQASSPVGYMPPTLNMGSTYIDTPGFQGTTALIDTGGLKTQGGLYTGWNTSIHQSFTVSFWFYDPQPPSSGIAVNYLFGDSLAGFNMVVQLFNGNIRILCPIEGFPLLLSQYAPDSVPHSIHYVYNDRPTTLTSGSSTVEAPYGTVSLYIDAFLQTTQKVIAPVNINGSGLVLAKNVSPILNYKNLSGNLDEFRWYDRALTATEIANTHHIDITPLGNCAAFSHFKMDSISGRAARITWTPGAGNTSFFLEYDSAGFTPGTGTLVTGTYPADDPKVILQGLLPEGEYDIYFGEICSGGDSIYNPAPYTIATTIPCQLPGNLQASNITTSSAGLNWDYIGPLQEFYLIYGPIGFDPANSGQTDTLSTTSTTLTNLSAGTRYDIYLAANCGSGNGFSDTIKLLLTTNCHVYTAPFFEDFEDSTWSPRSYLSSPKITNDTINPCWKRSPSWLENGVTSASVFDWCVRTGQAPSSTYGPLYGKGGSGNYLCTERIVTSKVGDAAIIYSPFIDVSSLTNPYLSFFYHRYGPSQPDTYVEINDGTGWTTLITMNGSHQQLRTDAYDSTGIDISAFGSTVQVRFRALLTGSGSFMGIDNFEIKEAPPTTCPEIQEIVNSGMDTDSSVTLDLLNNNYEFVYEWGPQGFAQGTGCITIGLNPINISSCLSLNSIYDLYVQSDCQDSGLGVSPFAGPFTFCSPFVAPYSTSFDNQNAGTDPECWKEYSKASIGASTQGIEVFDYDGKSFSDPQVLRIYDDHINAGDTIMAMSPRFADLTQGDKQIRFLAYSPSVRGGTPSTPAFPDKELVIGTMSSYENGATFNPIDTLLLSNSKWEEFIVELDTATSPYNGTDQIVALRYLAKGNSVTKDYCYIDNFNYELIPPCAAPDLTSLKSIFITSTSAKFTWLSQSSGQTEVAWGKPGFIPGDIKEIGTATTSDTFYTVTGLTPTTSYDIYIRGNCSGGSTYWVGPLKVTTACTPVVAPYFEDFDGPDWIAPNRYLNYYNCGDGMDQCWSRIGTCTGDYPFNPNYTWGVQNSGCPTQDHGGSGNFIFPVTVFNDTAYLYSPIINTSALTAPYLSFYYHRPGSNMADVWIDVNDGNGWKTVLTFTGQQQTSCNNPYRKAGADISTFGDSVQIRFRAAVFDNTTKVRETEMAIDDLRIDERPSCLDPENLSANITLDTALGKWVTTLNWDDPLNTNPQYEIRFGLEGFVDNGSFNAGQWDTISTTTYLLDSLIPNRCYQYVVRALCGPNDSGSFVGPFSFCTPCTPELAPYVEPFSITQTLEPGSDCWERQLTIDKTTWGDYQWAPKKGPATTSLSTGPAAGVYNSDYLYAESADGKAGDSTALYSPMIDISMLSTPEMSFYYHLFGFDIDGIYVDLFDGVNWYNNVLSLVGMQQNSATAPWKEATLNLQPYTNTGYLQARFRTTNGGSLGDVAIDEFRVTDSSYCPYPFHFRFKDSTSYQQTSLLWSDSSGTSQNYVVEYGPTGFTYHQGTQVLVNGDSVSIPVNDNRIYDAYLGNICNPGDTSHIVGPIQFYSRVFPCDDLEAYAPGPLDNQSSLYRPWDPSGPNGGFGVDGDDEIDTNYSVSGKQSLHMYEGPNGGAGILTDIEEIKNGLYSIGFSILITDTGGAYYEIKTQSGTSALFYFNKLTGLCEVSNSAGGLGVFPFTNSWNHIQHIIDFQNDTTWIISNNTNMKLGWHYSRPIDQYPSFKGLHFVTTPSNIIAPGKASEFYLDDFCADTFTCPTPSLLNVDKSGCTYAIVNWLSGIDSSIIILEYDTAGFVQGTGNILYPNSSIDSLGGLTPGAAYDIYVGEICGFDTVFTGPLNVSLPSSAVANFSSILGNPTKTNLTVDFDGSSSVAAMSYQWDFGDGITGTGPNPIHTYFANGVYSVTLIIDGDCGTDTITKQINIQGIELEENPLYNSLEIYPNPASTILVINFDGQDNGNAALTVRDMAGRLVYRLQLDDVNGKYTHELNVSDWADGTYILEVRSGDQIAHKALSKW